MRVVRRIRSLIPYVWTGKFLLGSGKEKFEIQNYSVTCGRGLRVSKWIDYIVTTVTSTRVLGTFVGARGYLGRKYRNCTGKTPERLIRCRGIFDGFMFRFLNENLCSRQMSI